MEINCNEYIMNPEHNRLFAMFTTGWITAGGLCQVLIVISNLWRRDPLFLTLPTTIRVLLFIATLFLMGPVVMNLYAAYCMLFHENNNRKEELR